MYWTHWCYKSPQDNQHYIQLNMFRWSENIDLPHHSVHMFRCIHDHTYLCHNLNIQCEKNPTYETNWRKCQKNAHKPSFCSFWTKRCLPNVDESYKTSSYSITRIIYSHAYEKKSSNPFNHMYTHGYVLFRMYTSFKLTKIA